MPHHEQGPDPRPHHDRDGHNGPPPPHHHSHRSRNAILICLAVLLTFAFIFWLTDPVGFRERMETAAKMEQEYAQNRPVPTPIMTDPGTTPPPIGATPSAVPEKTEKPAATKAPEKEPAETGALEVYIIDVGQADSIFLRSPKGKTMLIDSGEAQNYDDVCAFLKEQGVTKLDVVVATHPHNDHIGSMYKIINTYEIGKFYMPAVTHNTATYEKMLDALADKNITPRIAYAKPNAKIAWGDGSVTARIVSPFEGVEYEMNDWSIVLHVSFKDTSILLTADAETYAESVMLANLTAADLDADVLIILTAVDYVYVNFNKPDQRRLEEVTVEEMERHIKEGQFAKGSMLPKVEACLRFVRGKNKKEAIITSLEKAGLAATGEIGTRIIADRG